MKRVWLIFSQAVTVSLAVLFVLSSLRPELLGRPAPAPSFANDSRPQPPDPAAKVTTQSDLPGFRTAATKAASAVVNVYTTQETKRARHPLMNDPFFRRFFGDPSEDDGSRVSSLGSGVLVTADGMILTNHHVVEAADGIEVALSDGRKLPARIVGTDPDTDLAVLQASGPNLGAITFGDSDSLRVGDLVLAIGNPFGVGQTVTMGIVSALGRSHLGLSTFENFIQTDAAINPGNSGGALIDTSGNLVGINSAIYSRSGGSMGIGFAIPSSVARQVMEQIITSGTVTRGWIGVEVQELSAELAESFKMSRPEGTIIAGVLRGGPADRAGIRLGDILTHVDGGKVADTASMLNLIAGLKPGQAAVLTIYRDGEPKQVPIVVGKRPHPRDK